VTDAEQVAVDVLRSAGMSELADKAEQAARNKHAQAAVDAANLCARKGAP
jgi:hypothetical protein